MSAAPDRSAIRSAIERWGLVADGAIIDTPSGCVALVARGAERLVLKVIGMRSDEIGAIAAYRHYDGRGAVKLLAHASRALLLERALPGHALTRDVMAGNDDGATAILCDLMAALHRDGLPADRFPTTEDGGRSFADYQQTAGPLPVDLVERAAALYDELCRSQGPRILLHGDLHHDNVLYDQRRGWLAIDPKGVIGERAYEVGALLRNPTEDASRFARPDVIDRRVRILCERLALDRARVLGWCFAQAVLSAIWAQQDGTADRRGLVTPYATLPLLL